MAESVDVDDRDELAPVEECDEVVLETNDALIAEIRSTYRRRPDESVADEFLAERRSMWGEAT